MRPSCWNCVLSAALVALQPSLVALHYGRLREGTVAAGRIDDSGVTAHCVDWPLVQRIYAKYNTPCRTDVVMRHRGSKSVWEVEGVEVVMLKARGSIIDPRKRTIL